MSELINRLTGQANYGGVTDSGSVFVKAKDLKDLLKELKKRDAVIEVAKDVIHNNTGSGWKNSFLDDALDKLTEALKSLTDV